MSTHQLSDDGRNVDELVISRSRGFQYGDKTVTFRTPIIPVVLRILGYQSGRTSNFIPSPPSNSQGIYDLCILKDPMLHGCKRLRCHCLNETRMMMIGRPHFHAHFFLTFFFTLIRLEIIKAEWLFICIHTCIYI